MSNWNIFSGNANLYTNAQELLDKYLGNYSYDGATEHGLREIFTETETNKAPFIEALSSVDGWDGEGRVIIHDAPMRRSINVNILGDFEMWFISGKGNEAFRSVPYTEERQRTRSAVTRIVDAIKDKAEYDPLASVISADILESIHESVMESVRIREGEKALRVLCRIIEKLLPEVAALDLPYEETWTLSTGEVRSRKRNDGWKGWKAKLGDAMSPSNDKGTFVLSINPLDWWTMSFLPNAQSCHTIDKDNVRQVSNSGSTYHGMYCSGTESYMLDTVSLIGYYVKQEWNPETAAAPLWELPKLHRCVFNVGETGIVQNRVYPDGRDGGVTGIAVDMWENALSILKSAGLYAEGNWEVKKGSLWRREAENWGTHYPDNYHCDDTILHVFTPKGEEKREWKKIRIGHDPICPGCGNEHSTTENVFCDYCAEGEIECECCGHGVSRREAIEIDGYYYCPDCVSVCDDCGEYYVSENYYDSYNGGQYLDNYDRYVCNHCLENDYTYTENDEYVRNEDVIETEEGDYFSVDDEDDYFVCPICGEYHTAPVRRRWRSYGAEYMILPNGEEALVCGNCVDQVREKIAAKAKAEEEAAVIHEFVVNFLTA